MREARNRAEWALEEQAREAHLGRYASWEEQVERKRIRAHQHLDEIFRGILDHRVQGPFSIKRRFRNIWDLVHTEKCTVPEAAESLGLSTKEVKATVAEIARLLKQAYQEKPWTLEYMGPKPANWDYVPEVLVKACEHARQSTKPTVKMPWEK